MGYLIYQEPGGNIEKWEGVWHNKSLETMPESAFFITDFTLGKSYFFEKMNRIDSLPNEGLSFYDDQDVFVVDGKHYLNGLQFFQDGFADEGIKKAIYSRIKTVERYSSDNLSNIFEKLVNLYSKESLIYWVSDVQFGTWMGATPEILVAGDENGLKTMALAGTKKEKAIAWTKKETEEHQFVVDFINENLKNINANGIQSLPTYTTKAGAVYHLKTDIRFDLPKEKWNQLLNTLHPTPAVCGTPQKEAMDYILRYEPHQRGFYTGLIGYKSATKLSVYVNLRCMQVLKNKFAMYLGGGITSSSNIVNEWQETEDKSETLLQAL